MTYAGLTDVTSRWGHTPSDEESTLITTRLGDAERMINRELKKLDLTLVGQIASDAVDVEDVKQVEAEAVLRLIRNYDGYSSETDGSYTYAFMENLATGTLEILPEEWEMLSVQSFGMFEIAPRIAVHHRHIPELDFFR